VTRVRAVPLRSEAPLIERFAAEFLETLNVGESAGEEALAEFTRARFELGPFPRDADLHRVLRELGVRTAALPDRAPMDGANYSHPDAGTAIHLRDDLPRARFETTLAHELREVIENAFRQVDRDYPAIPTNDNKRMNPHSDRFASVLLMQKEASQRLFETLGYDPITFASQTGRSLSSVIVRMQTLFPKGCGLAAPIAGYWLYEPPLRTTRRASVSELVVRQIALLNGFSLARARPESRALAELLPMRHASVFRSPDACEAIRSGHAQMRTLPVLDRFGESHVVFAEPVTHGSVATKVLLAAIHFDCLPLVTRWFERAGLWEGA